MFLGSKVEIEGSLGGLQVLDLTPEGHMHQRIVSVGKDLLQEDQIHPLYLTAQDSDREKAFSFKVVRNLEPKNDRGNVCVAILSVVLNCYCCFRRGRYKD